MKRFCAIVLWLVGIVPAALGSFLANDHFQDAPLVGLGQIPTILPGHPPKLCHPTDIFSIKGIQYWKHSPYARVGLEKDLQGDQYLFVSAESESSSPIQQECAIPIQAGQVWQVTGIVGFFETPWESQNSAVDIELWAGSIDPGNPAALVNATLVEKRRIGAIDWNGSADDHILPSSWYPVTFAYTVPHNSPLIGRHLVLKIYATQNSVTGSRWKLAKLTLTSEAKSGGSLDFKEGNGASKISGIDPSFDGTSSWSAPALWEESSQSVRVPTLAHGANWLMLPQHVTNNGQGLLAEYFNKLKWKVYFRSLALVAHPLAAIVTANGTYYYSLPTFSIPHFWHNYSVALESRHWRKGHYLLGPSVSQAQFAYDLIGTQSIHLFSGFAAADGGASFKEISVFPFGKNGGLTVNCTVITDGYLGKFTTQNVLARAAYVYQYDQGERVGRAQLVGSLAESGIGLVNAVPGTFECYSGGDQFLRTNLGTITVPATSPITDVIWLRNGDCDNDGAVSFFDYILLSDAFDSSPGSANWNSHTDLDGDLVVSIFDYLILSNRFDQVDDQ